ncbi:MAG: DNA polymerase III subunit delta [Pseudomonadota bacterium]
MSCVLIHGDDEGVVGDTASALLSAWQKGEPSAVVTLDEDEVKRDPSHFFDALEAQSLLGERTLLRVRTSGEKLFTILKDVLALPAERLAARLVVMAGQLNTRSKLRTAFETAPSTAALHVFADSDTDLAALIQARLGDQGITLKSDALSLFVGGLPGHRALANAEIEKLSLYAHALGRPVTRSDIRALCETHADESARAAVHLALDGDRQAAQAEMDRVIDAGVSAISVVRLFEMEAARMVAAQALMAEGTGGPALGMKLKPPVWKSDWPAFQKRLSRWPAPRLTRLIERLHDLELAAKSPGGAGLAEPAMRELFTVLYKVAAAGNRAGS